MATTILIQDKTKTFLSFGDFLNTMREMMGDESVEYLADHARDLLEYVINRPGTKLPGLLSLGGV